MIARKVIVRDGIKPVGYRHNTINYVYQGQAIIDHRKMCVEYRGEGHVAKGPTANHAVNY